MEHVRYDLDDAVAVITLDRPQAANAQNVRALTELDAAWTLAERDPAVKVIVLRSDGKHFSAGHDMTGSDEPEGLDDAVAYYDWEVRGYLHYALRWRNVPKPSIAAVQGKCIAGGLMLCWPCDLIVAADDAQFSDPVLHMGLLGVELHAHAFELGARKAKELLFTAGSIDAEEARACGMVNRVVALDDLVPATMALAHQIAEMDAFALRMAKRAVNTALDHQGYTSSVQAAFDMHHLGHMRAALAGGADGSLVDLDEMKRSGRAAQAGQ